MFLAEKMARKIALMYRDEESLQYFFVCHLCDARYDTTHEIIEHVGVGCRKSAIWNIDEESTPQYKRACRDGNNRNFSGNSFWKSISGNDFLFDKSDVKLTVKDEIIEISDSDDEMLQVKEEIVSVTSPNTRYAATSDISTRPTRNFISDTDTSKATEEPLTTVHGGSLEFPCQLCNHIFHASETLLSHLMQIHQKDTRLKKCPAMSCGKMFMRPINFERHIREHIRNKIIVPGEITEAVNRTLQEIVGNKAVGRKKERFCKICSFEFFDKKNFERHLEIHRMSFKCSKCNQFCGTPARLMVHSMREHDNIANPKCKYCGISFKYYHSLENHLYESHIDSVRNLKLPIDANIRPEIYQCNECKKEFYVKANLKKHLFTHLTSNANRVRGLATKGNIDSGSRVNPDISEWDEGILMNNFDKLLDEHPKVNSIGEMSYACKLCDEKYTEITTATLHICQKHLKQLYDLQKCKIDEISGTPNWNMSFNSKIGCPYCKKIFSEKFGNAGLHQHILQIHKRISCSQCNLIFQDTNFHAHFLDHYRVAGSKNDGLSLNGKLNEFLNEKTVLDEKQNFYSCLICGQHSKRYIAADQTHEHILTHIYENPILQTGSSTNETVKHDMVHSAAGRNKEFKCSRCLECFVTRLGVREHKRLIHDMDVERETASETSDSDCDSETESDLDSD